MNRFSNLTTILGLVGVEAIASGCSSYPQYSGQYELQSVSYTDPEFAGEKKMSWDLTITHRMKYVPGSLDDRLRFEFNPKDPNTEIGGSVMFDLQLLTKADESSFPHEYFRGETIHEERTYYGGAFCNYQYQHQAFAVLTPEYNKIKEVYFQNGASLGIQPAGNPISETKYPEEMEIDEDAVDRWDEAVENNGDKITIELFIERNILDTLSGCYANDGWLPPDDRGAESLHAVYHSTELNDEEDPREGFDELVDNNIQPIDLFKDVISGVKDLD